jgi:hypothetical protein
MIAAGFATFLKVLALALAVFVALSLLSVNRLSFFSSVLCDALWSG